MNKLIIDNRTDRTLLDLWPYIQTVLEGGLESNDGKQHSYATTWADGIVIASYLNEKSERFTIYFDPDVIIGFEARLRTQEAQK